MKTHIEQLNKIKKLEDKNKNLYHTLFRVLSLRGGDVVVPEDMFDDIRLVLLENES